MIKGLCKAALILALCSAQADDSYPDITLGGLLDLRAARTDDTTSWLDHGLGKTRYGGTAGDSRVLGRVAEAALLITSHLNWSTSGQLYIKYDADQHQPLDIVEGFVDYHPVSTTAYRFTGRVGAFFPPVSLENTGPAWTSPYSITPSAINTWIGEEVRTLGGEGTLHWLGEEQRASASLAVYKANDPTGSLIAWRGWALHDFKPGLHDRMPLAHTEIFDDFPRQAPWVAPFREIDGHWGYYGALAYERPGKYTLRAMHYDNRANPDAFNGTQWAWHTRFSSVGMKFLLPHDVDMIAQYLFGDTYMRGRRAVVDTDFSSWFVLLSKRIDQHRFTLRYDLFGVQDNAGVEYNDHGHAWTLAYALEVNDKQRLILELLSINSKHPQRDDLGLPAVAREHLLQASYRIFF